MITKYQLNLKSYGGGHIQKVEFAKETEHFYISDKGQRTAKRSVWYGSFYDTWEEAFIAGMEQMKQKEINLVSQLDRARDEKKKFNDQYQKPK